MKIGILTQPLQTNYGGLLQNYALQQVLKNEGHQVETIDWAEPNSIRFKLAIITRNVLSGIFPKHFPYMYFPSDMEKKLLKKNTNRFIDRYIKHTSTICSKRGFRKQAEIGKYDAYVVGSDQCWRPCYNPFLLAMFLDFIKTNRQVKRLAYAVSFGTQHWEYSPETTKKCAHLAQLFDFVSVREDSGVKLCHDYLGVDAIFVLDPTMLLTKDDYIKIIERENEPEAAGKLFYYFLDPNTQKREFVQQLSDILGLKSFHTLPKIYGKTVSSHPRNVLHIRE